MFGIFRKNTYLCVCDMGESFIDEDADGIYLLEKIN